MTAAEHSVVWESAVVRLHKASEAARAGGFYDEQTALLRFAVFAGSVAAAYQDHATVFKEK